MIDEAARDAMAELQREMEYRGSDTSMSVTQAYHRLRIALEAESARTPAGDVASALRQAISLAERWLAIKTGTVNVEELAPWVERWKAALSGENEEEHAESCQCCQDFMRMEKRYDHLRGYPQDDEHFVHVTAMQPVQVDIEALAKFAYFEGLGINSRTAGPVPKGWWEKSKAKAKLAAAWNLTPMPDAKEDT